MKQKITPQRLYRYRSLADSGIERLRAMVFNAEHYFSSSANFNDPFDCRPVHRLNGSDEDVTRYLERLSAKFEPEQTPEQRSAEIASYLADPDCDPRRSENQKIVADLFTRSFTDQLGMLCLSTRPDVPLMWSHYADSHAGVCLGFDPEVSFFALARPVRYTNTRPCVDPTILSDEQMIEANLYTKSIDWAYEEEWRIVLESRPGNYKMHTNALRSIIFGAKVSHANFKEILSWTKMLPQQVEVFKTTFSTSSFELKLQRIL